MYTSDQILAAARSWIGTPFVHQGRLKGVGVDCVGLLVGVGRELGMVAPDFDVEPYPRIPDGVTLLGRAGLHLTPAEPGAPLQPGDIVVVRFRKYPQHFGIVGEHVHGGLSIVHADALSDRCVETRLMFSPTMLHVATFKFPGAV